MKKYGISVVVIFIIYFVIDYLVHSILLKQAYMDTTNLWRPEAEMNCWLMWIATLVGVLCFVWIYHRFVTAKNVHNGLHYGFVWGLAGGVCVSFVCYSVMPIPAMMAAYWFVEVLVEAILAGLVVGFVYGEGQQPQQS